MDSIWMVRNKSRTFYMFSYFLFFSQGACITWFQVFFCSHLHEHTQIIWGMLESFLKIYTWWYRLQGYDLCGRILYNLSERLSLGIKVLDAFWHIQWVLEKPFRFVVFIILIKLSFSFLSFFSLLVLVFRFDKVISYRFIFPFVQLSSFK